MTAAEFDTFIERQEVEYAGSLRARFPEAAARQKARQDMERLLPDGLDTDGHRLFVALDGTGAIVGKVRLGPDQQTGDPAIAWLHEIHVEEEHRGQGVGRELMAAIEDAARVGGATQLDLDVFAGNTAAVALYRSRGFAVTTQQMSTPLR